MSSMSSAHQFILFSRRIFLCAVLDSMTGEQVKAPELCFEKEQDRDDESIYITWYGSSQAFSFALMFKSVSTLWT